MKFHLFSSEKYDWIISAFISIVLIMSFLVPEYKYMMLYNVMYLTIGIIGIIYTVYTLCIFFFNKIEFDRILMKKNFLHKVVNIALLIPLIITILFVGDKLFVENTTVDYASLQKSMAKELVFGDNLYDKEYKELSISDTNDIDKVLAFAVLSGWDVKHDTIDNSYILLNEVDVMPKNIVDSKNEEPSLFWSVYYHYVDSGNQHIASTEKGRKWATVSAIMGYIFLNGLFIAVLIGWFDRRRNEWIKGEVRYNRFLRRKKHYVIIGGNGMTSGVVKQLLKKDNYIIVQTSRDVELFRRELYSELSEEQKERIVIYYGNRTSKADIEDLMLRSAIDIYVLGESLANDGQNHDAFNMDCLRLITDALPDGIDKKNVYVIFENYITFSAFQFSDISECDKRKINYVPLNYYEMWAQKILACSDPTDILKKKNESDVEYYPLDTIRDDKGLSYITRNAEHYVHLVIIGMSKMGVAMGLETAHTSHYPNSFINNIFTPPVPVSRS